MNKGLGTLREFDGFRLDPGANVLWYEDNIVPLPPKAVELLVELTAEPGKVVSKDELMYSVWGDSFVEESNLTHNIYLLRKTLDAISGNEYIETIPRRGYRFVANVEELVENREVTIERRVFTRTIIEEIEGDPDETPAAAITVKPVRTATVSRQRSRLGLAAALGGLMVIALGAAFWTSYSRGSAGSIEGIRTIAVLPIRAEGDVEESLRFTLSDWLTSRLNNLGVFSVRPSAAMSPYDNDLRDPITIGRMLELDAILDGRIQAENGRLRINLQLIDLRSGENIWTGQFNGSPDAMLDIQDEIIAAFVSDTGLKHPGGDRRLRPTENIEAFMAYHRGRVLFSDLIGHPSNWDNAVREFETALSKDPGFTLALTGLADVYTRKANQPSFNAREKYYEMALEYARRAVTEDPDLAEAHISYAWIKRNYEWDFAGSEAHFRKALRLSPENPEAHRQFSFLLTTLGRHQEAVDHARRSVELAPEQMNHIRSYALILIYARKYEEALRQHEHFFSLHPDNTNEVRYVLWALYALGRDSDLIARFESSPEEAQGSFQARMYYALAVRRSRSLEEGDRLVTELAREAPERIDKRVRFAVVLTTLGRFSEALDCLEEGLRMRDDRMVTVRGQPEFEALRGEPRFQAILREMQLAE